MPAPNWPGSSNMFQRRPPFEQLAPLAVPPGLEGYAPGTPALPQMRRQTAHREAGAGGSELTSIPGEYRWDGNGACPPDLYALAVAVSCLFGVSAAQAPAIGDPNVGDFVGAAYQALTDAGLSHDDVYGTITAFAPAGPQAIANALQQKIARGPGRNKLKPCAPPQAPAPARRPPVMRSPVPRQPAPTPATIQITAEPAPEPEPVQTTAVVAQKPPAAGGKPPWGWIIGGVGLAAAIGVGWYFATRKPKKRKNPMLEVRENPCACSNPSDVIDTEGYEIPIDEISPYRRPNPYSGTRGYTSVDPQMLEFDAQLGMSPGLRVNPSRRGKKRRRPKA